MKQHSLMQAVLLGSALSLATLSGVSCASNEAKSAANPEMDKFSEAYAAAEAEVKKASASGFEWRDTGKFLKESAEAAKTGDYAKAMKLAAKAQDQAVLAQKQAEDQANPTWHF